VFFCIGFSRVLARALKAASLENFKVGAKFRKSPEARKA
jgi:hypothetical protein